MWSLIEYVKNRKTNQAYIELRVSWNDDVSSTLNIYNEFSSWVFGIKKNSW